MITKPNSGKLGQRHKELKFTAETDPATSTEQQLERRIKELTAINRLAREVSASLFLKQVVAATYQQVHFAVSPDLTFPI
jgi:hypothetical protein